MTSLRSVERSVEAKVELERKRAGGREGEGGMSDNHITSHPLLETSPSSTSGGLNSCHSLWTASPHWWQARQVTSQLHSPASGGTVGGDWLYD